MGVEKGEKKMSLELTIKKTFILDKFLRFSELIFCWYPTFQNKIKEFLLPTLEKFQPCRMVDFGFETRFWPYWQFKKRNENKTKTAKAGKMRKRSKISFLNFVEHWHEKSNCRTQT